MFACCLPTTNWRNKFVSHFQLSVAKAFLAENVVFEVIQYKCEPGEPVEAVSSRLASRTTGGRSRLPRAGGPS